VANVAFNSTHTAAAMVGTSGTDTPVPVARQSDLRWILGAVLIDSGFY